MFVVIYDPLEMVPPVIHECSDVDDIELLLQCGLFLHSRHQTLEAAQNAVAAATNDMLETRKITEGIEQLQSLAKHWPKKIESLPS